MCTKKLPNNKSDDKLWRQVMVIGTGILCGSLSQPLNQNHLFLGTALLVFGSRLQQAMCPQEDSHQDMTEPSKQDSEHRWAAAGIGNSFCTFARVLPDLAGARLCSQSAAGIGNPLRALAYVFQPLAGAHLCTTPVECLGRRYSTAGITHSSCTRECVFSSLAGARLRTASVECLGGRCSAAGIFEVSQEPSQAGS